MPVPVDKPFIDHVINNAPKSKISVVRGSS